MGFLDLFLLSCSSLKTKKIVKHVFTVRKHELVVDFQDALKLIIQSVTNPTYGEAIYLNSKDEQEDKVFHVKIGAVDRVPSDYAKEEGNHDALVLTTYWDDPKNGFNVLHDAVNEVFQATVKEVMIDLNEVAVESYQNVIDWVENQFPTLPTFRIIGRCSFQNYLWMMKNVKAKNSLLFSMEPTEYPENHETVNLESEKIGIDHGKWIRLQDLQAMKARIIFLSDVSLTEQEINMFLRNLQALKEESYLRRLTFDFYREVNLEIVLEGLKVTEEEKPEDSLNQWSFEMENGAKCTVLYAEYEDEDADLQKFGFEIEIGN
ncbi:unnamed protein product [Caenorhabditis brenneri]